MRKFFSAARHCAAILGLIVLGAAMMRAQPSQPCVPDCPDDHWSVATKQITLLVPNDGTIPGYTGGCVLTVDYVTRLACGRFHDFQIVRMRVDISAACGPVLQWLVAQENSLDRTVLNGWTKIMYNKADDMIAMAEFAGFYNGQTPEYQNRVRCGVGSDLQWRSSKQSCADWVITCVGGEYVAELLPCPEAGCCLQYFEICYDPVLGPVVKRTGSPTPTGPCGFSPYLNCFGGIQGEKCLPLCDD